MPFRSPHQAKEKERKEQFDIFLNDRHYLLILKWKHVQDNVYLNKWTASEATVYMHMTVSPSALFVLLTDPDFILNSEFPWEMLPSYAKFE